MSQISQLNKMPCMKQFGFRNNRCTMHAITELTEKITQACDSG